VSTCFHYQIKKCKGVCTGEEAISKYNKRVLKAIDSVRFAAENFIIKEAGRTNQEYGYALVLNGIYKGFGYMNKRKKIRSVNTYLDGLTLQKDNNDIKRILNGYLKGHEENMYPLEPDAMNTSDFYLETL
jgi:DNA polymerase-3 subunit epsilon